MYKYNQMFSVILFMILVILICMSGKELAVSHAPP